MGLNVRIAPPNMSRIYTILRYAGAALLAGALVFFGAGLIVHKYLGGRQSDQMVGLTVIRGIKLLTHVPGQASSSSAAKAQQQQLKGFVQVGFTVGPDGRAHHIHVISAEPPGHNEEAAREIIASRHFKPVKPGSKASGVERSEVVHFQVPASVLTGGSGSGSGSS